MRMDGRRTGGGSMERGVGVSLLVRKPEGGFGHCLVGGAQTDENGRYRIEGLPAATYVVEVAMLGGMVPVQGGEEGTQGLKMYARVGRSG